MNYHKSSFMGAAAMLPPSSALAFLRYGTMGAKLLLIAHSKPSI